MSDRIEPLTAGERVALDPITVRDEAIIRERSMREHDQLMRHRAGRNLWVGILLGGLIAVVATAYFAQQSGSFANAGAVLDKQINSTTFKTQGAAADAARSVGSVARETGNSVDQKMADVADKAQAK